VVIAPREQRGARRRAQRGGMKAVVAQPSAASLSRLGVSMSPPKVPAAPNPVSSNMAITTFGAPAGAWLRTTR